MTNPIILAMQFTPFWMRDIHLYDGVEVHPVRDVLQDYPDSRSASDETWCEVCAPEEANFWSVYGHLKMGGIECFEDFPTRHEADAFALQLQGAYPHLA